MMFESDHKQDQCVLLDFRTRSQAEELSAFQRNEHTNHARSALERHAHGNGTQIVAKTD